MSKDEDRIQMVHTKDESREGEFSKGANIVNQDAPQRVSVSEPVSLLGTPPPAASASGSDAPAQQAAPDATE